MKNRELIKEKKTFFPFHQETYERERSEHGKTLERLDAVKTKQQQQQMMQRQEQQQIRELHKESLDQILSLEERIRQLEMQELGVDHPVAGGTLPTTMSTTMPTTTTTMQSLTDQQKSGSKGNRARRGAEVSAPNT